METQPGISLKTRPYFTDCIHWNDNGQLSVCIDNGVHIVTPVLTGVSSKYENYAHAGFTLPPFPSDRDSGHDPVAPDEIQTSYFNEEGFRCAAWSPSGMSPSQSCLLTAVTTKHRVLIYHSSTKNPLSGDWQLYADITSVIEDKGTHPSHHTLYASWSKLLLGNTLDSKFALLALSHKAGSVSVWTQSLDHGIQYATEVSPHTSFVNLIGWSAWKKINEITYVAFLASSSTNGTVALSSVQVNLSKGNKQSIESVQMNVLYRWFENDAAVPTLLKVYDDSIEDASYFNIAVCKGVSVYIISIQVAGEENAIVKNDWTLYTLQHSGAGLSAGSWINQNTFRCYTFEGEGIYLILKEDGNIEEDKEQAYKLNQKLIQKYKQQWMEEQIKIEEDDILGASDAIPYLWGASDGRNKIITAIYCTMKPTVDVHYRPESEEDSTIAFILQKERGIGVNDACDDLDRYVYNPDFIFTYPVQAIVHETLEYLLNEDDMSDFKMWLIKLDSLLQQRPELDGKDLTRALFSSPSTIAARIIINAEIKLKHYNLLQATSVFEDACRRAKHVIQLYYLSHTLDLALRLSDGEFGNLGEQDVTELLILSDLALALHDEQLIQTASQVYKRLQKSFTSLDLSQELEYATNFNSQSSAAYTLKPREKCPVCNEAVNAIGNSSLAQCNTGHIWELCSITKRVLLEAKARKCLTCGAKSLMAKDNTFTDKILKGCSRCLNCGSGFYFQ